MKKSVFRALIWKEWRQQRWVFGAIAALVVLGLAALLLMPVKDNRHPGGNVYVMMIIVTGIGLSVAPLALGANAFCGEEDDGSTRYLRTVPVGSLKLFIAKALMVWGLTLALWLPAAALAPHILQTQHWKPEYWLDVLVRITGALLAFSLLPATASLWAKRTMPNIFVSLLLGALFTGGLVQYMDLLDSLEYAIGGQLLLANFIGAILFTILLLPAWLWTWSRTERTIGRRIGRMFSALVCLVLCATVLPFCAWLYLVFLAPMHAFAIDHVVPSPDGQYVAVSCGMTSRYWPKRVALIDVDRGNVKWVTRLHGSFFPYMYAWSSSGNRVIVMKTGAWFMPYAGPEYRGSAYSPGFLQVPSNRFIRLKGKDAKLDRQIRDGHIGPHGWVNEEKIFLMSGTRGTYFADASDGIVREWDASTPYGYRVLAPGTALMSNFEILDNQDHGILTISRRKLGQDKAETISVRLPTGSAFVRAASPAGEWLVVYADAQLKRTCYLLPFRQDAVPILIASASSEYHPVVEGAKRFGGFMPDGDRILLIGSQNLFIYTIATGESLPVLKKEVPSQYSVHQVVTSPDMRRAILTWEFFPGETTGPTPDLGIGPVIDLETNESWPGRWNGADTPQWLGNDKLIWKENNVLMTCNYDGTDVRKLLD